MIRRLGNKVGSGRNQMCRGGTAGFGFSWNKVKNARTGPKFVATLFCSLRSPRHDLILQTWLMGTFNLCLKNENIMQRVFGKPEEIDLDRYTLFFI